jgi:uncharacterized damage-inducible protein DinB
MIRYDLELPSDLHPEIAVLVGAWRDGTREWLGEVGEVSDELVTRRFGPHGVSVGALILHMVDCDEGWIGELLLGDSGGPPTEAGAFCKALSVDERIFPDPPPWPFSQYVRLMQDTRARLVRRLAGLGPEEERSTGSGDVYTVRWVLAHLVQHDSYHGGQIALLLADFAT